MLDEIFEGGVGRHLGDDVVFGDRVVRDIVHVSPAPIQRRVEYRRRRADCRVDKKVKYVVRSKRT